MSATIKHSGLDSGIKVMSRCLFFPAVAVTYEPTGELLFSPMTSPYPYGDPMVQILDNSMWDHGIRDSLHTLGFASQDLTDRYDVEVEGLPPENTRYHSPIDHHRYGKLLSNILVLSANQALSASRFKRDKEVTHANLSGTIVPLVDSTDFQVWYSVPFLAWGQLLPGVSAFPLGYAGLGVQLAGAIWCSLPLGPSSYLGASTTGGRALLHEILRNLGDFEWRGAPSGLTRLLLLRKISNFTWTFSSDYVEVNYNYDLFEEKTPGGVWGRAKWKCQVRFYLVPSNPPIVRGFVSPSNPSPPYGNYSLKVEYYYDLIEGEYVYNSDIVGQPSFDPVTSSLTSRTYLWSDASSGIYVDSPEIARVIWKKADDFSRFHLRELKHIRPAAFYSTADAVEEHISTLDTNFVESASELPELAALIPSARDLVKALHEFKSSPGQAAGHFGDFLSDITLKHNFGWRPNAEAIREFNRYGPTLVDSFERFTTPKVIQLAGKFVYPLPFHPYWGERLLTVRSTIALAFNDNTFAQQILSIDSAGALPDLHQVWEALPYSFAIDWVTAMGRRLHDVDTLIKMSSLMQLHWSEHTYRVVSDLPLSVDLDGIDRERTDLEFVWFRRDLSRLMPSLTDSKYDFRAAQGLSNYSNLLSLIFKRAR